MRITMVKKVLADGSPCRKCADIETRLTEAGLRDRIDRVIVAEEGNPASEGMRLAREFDVDVAPFFIVEEAGAAPRIYTVYFRLLKEVLQGSVTAQEEAAEIMDRNPDIDFI